MQCSAVEYGWVWCSGESSTVQCTAVQCSSVQFDELKYIFIMTKGSKLRCIGPPQSQSGPNNFAKTSVCADGSQHFHETNRINNFYTKSLRNLFLEDIFLCVDFWSFFMLKPCFWIFIKKNFHVTHIFKCLAVQNNPNWQNQLNFVKKTRLKW